jgi:hypothetical protein
LVLRSFGGRQVVALESPVEVRLYETTAPAGDSDEQELTDLVIASHGDSIAVASVGRRATDTSRFAAAVAEGTGAEPPRRDVLSVPERQRLRGDPTLRWLNAGGDFTPRQELGLWATFILIVPLTVLAGAALFAPPPASGWIYSAGDVRRALEGVHETLVTDLRGGPPVESPPAAPTVDVVASRCPREHGWVWGPADESYLDTTAVVTLRADAVAVVEQRLSAATKQSRGAEATWRYLPPVHGATGMSLGFTLDGKELRVSFSTECLTDKGQRALRPVVEDHARRVLEAVAGSS